MSRTNRPPLSLSRMVSARGFPQNSSAPQNPAVCTQNPPSEPRAGGMGAHADPKIPLFAPKTFSLRPWGRGMGVQADPWGVHTSPPPAPQNPAVCTQNPPSELLGGECGCRWTPG
uniref:Uncharacterized protein n=1 Tax=Otus sunia TaxID=257818 RepID=A0A8C8ACI3_9STRI